MAKQRTSTKASRGAAGLITGRTASQIIESVEAAIQRGSLANGEALPTIRTLADALGVNRNTVASAYRHLSDAGIIQGRGRQGSRVAMPGTSTSRGPTLLHDIGGGNPDNRLLPEVKNIFARAPWYQRGYEDPPDDRALIDFAERQFEKDRLPLGELWLANGTFDAVALILRSVLNAGDPVAVEDPCFMTTLGLLRELGHKPIPMQVDEQGVQPKALDAALQSGAKAVILTPRAQNPFGGSWTAKRRDELAVVIKRHKDVLLIEDDHFAPLSPFQPVTLVSDDRPNWAIIRSVSKYIGPDLRLAFVNSSVGLGKGALSITAFTYRWVSSILQRVVLATVTSNDYEAVLKKAAIAYKERRNFFLKALKDVGIAAHGADGINVWIPVKDEQAVARRLMEAGWIVRPGSIFRLETPEAIRVTTSSFTESESQELAELLSSLQRQGAVQRGA
jgi:DNA-binding transcriptional MocR family regulator